MHRSGTSALAGTLYQFGLDFGSELTKASASENPKGFFENVFVQGLNKEILAQENSSWDDYTFQISNITLDRFTQYVNEATKVIEKEFRYSDKFVVKDPRVCILFPIWEKACQELGIEIKVILPYRNPLEVAESLKKRNEFLYEKSLLLWVYYFLNAEKYSRDYQRLFMYFDDLLNNTEENSQKLQDFTAVTLDKNSTKDVANFLDKEIKNNNLRLENFTKEIPSFFNTIIEIVQQKSFEDTEKFDEINNEFDYLLELFQPKAFNDDRLSIIKLEELLKKKDEELEVVNQNVNSLRHEHEELKNDLFSKEKKIKDNEEIITTFQQERESFNTTLEIVHQRVKTLEKMLTEKENETSSLKQELHILIEEKKSLNTLLETENERVKTLENELKENKSISTDQLRVLEKADVKVKNIKKQVVQYRSDFVSEYLYKEKKSHLNIQNFYNLKNHLDLKYHLINALALKIPILKKSSRFKKTDMKVKEVTKKFSRIPLDFVASFDENAYLSQNPDVKKAIDQKMAQSGLEHFILFGFDEVYRGKRKLHKNLDYYENCDASIELFKKYLKECYLNIDMGMNLSNSLIDTFMYEMEEESLSDEQKYKVIKESKLFDEKYYLESNMDVAKRKLNPIKHYILHGESENREPNKTFNPEAYKEKYKDVRESGISPFYHFVKNGVREGRSGIGKTKVKLTKDEEFKQIQESMHRYQSSLIDWEIEKRKVRNLNLISIVMPVYGQAKLTNEALKSLSSTDAGVEYEVIIINNGQNKDDRKELDKWSHVSNFKIVHNEENLNFALGCNLGFSLSLGTRVVFLNNDTTVTSGWLKKLVEPLNNENVSSTQPRLLYPDGNIQCMGIVFSEKSDIAYPIYQDMEISQEIIETNRHFQAITAACIALRADDFAILNGFDISFVNGQEDVDLCLRLNKLKNSYSLYVADSIVYHYEGKSKGRGRYVVNNRKEFLSRWRNKTKADDKFYYAADGYDVSEYIADSEEMKKNGIAFYKPILKFDSTSKRTPLNFSKYAFCLTGKKEIEVSNQTILLSAHAVGKMLFGGERSFLDMVQAISETNYNLIITIPNANNHIYIDMLLEYCSFIYVVPYNFWNPKGVSTLSTNLIQNIMTKHNIDLVYVNTIVCKEPLEAAKIFNIPKVIHVRELIDRDQALQKTIGKNSSQILEELKKSSDYIVANSEETLRLFKNIEKKGIIYNKIDTDYLNVPNVVDEKNISFVMISSNIPKKGIYDFLEIAKLCKNVFNATFVLVGPDNKYIEKLKEEAQESNLTNLIFKGYIEDPIEAVKSGNVVLSLSHFAESFGRTVGEALAARRPVISYSFGAIPELVKHQESGYLAEHKNVGEIVNYIKEICDNPKLIEPYGNKGREDIIKLSSSTVYNQKMGYLLKEALDLQKENTVEKDITIIIPVYNAFEEVRNCLDSIMNTVSSHENIQVLVMNDGSPDKRIAPMLEKYIQFDIIHNNQNLGYTKNINKGIELAKGKDIILLNSDTIVTEGWVNSLKSVAYSEETIGTVTAMSDNAGAFSFPEQGKHNEKPKLLTYNQYAKAIIKETEKCLPIEVTTGSGFCLFIKGELLKEIGDFDAVLFPKGYGEENEFCLRAIKHGWKNVISPKTFIFHIRSASFGEQKTKLMEQGLKRVLEHYPSYLRNVKKTFSSNQMNLLRESVVLARKKIDTMQAEK